jgi:hypothetical protein
MIYRDNSNNNLNGLCSDKPHYPLMGCTDVYIKGFVQYVKEQKFYIYIKFQIYDENDKDINKKVQWIEVRINKNSYIPIPEAGEYIEIWGILKTTTNKIGNNTIPILVVEAQQIKLFEGDVEDGIMESK